MLVTLLVLYLIGMAGSRATLISRQVFAGSCVVISPVWVIKRAGKILLGV